MQNLDRDKRESLIHTALIRRGDICGLKTQFGTKTADNTLRDLLIAYGSFEGIAKETYGEAWEKEVMRTEGIDALIKKLERIEFKTITVADQGYPLNYPDTSPVLYVRGDTSIFDTKTIAIVGTREISKKEDVPPATKYMDELIQQEYNVVSGLAKGCDTLAHAYFMAKGRKTIAIIGTPLDRHSPYQNKDLQEKIARDHLLVSQYPIGIDTIPGHFAYRNRTTVSLAEEGILVIAAGDKSGTQHAIRHCIKQEKELRVLHHTTQRQHEWTKKYEDKIQVPDAPADGPR